MGVLLHRHYEGAKKPPVNAEKKLEKEFEKAKEKANDTKRKNSNSKSVSK